MLYNFFPSFFVFIILELQKILSQFFINNFSLNWSRWKVMTTINMNYGDDTFRHEISLFRRLRHMVTKQHLSSNLSCQMS